MHVAAGEDVGGKWSGRSEGFPGHEMFGGEHDALLFGEFFFDHLAEHAFPKIIVVLQGELETSAHLAEITGVAMSWECGCSRLVPASRP